MSTEKIKVLHVIDHLDIGGAQQSLSLLLKHMDRDKYPCAVVTLHGEGYYFELLKERGVPVFSLGKSKANIWLWFAFRKLLRRLQPEIIHTHLLFSCLLTGMNQLMGWKAKILSHIRSENQFKYDTPRLKGVHAFFNRRADHVIAVSEQVKLFMEKDERVPSEKISVITNMVDYPMRDIELLEATQTKQRCNIPENSKLMLTVARLDRNKGILHVLEALSILKEEYSDLYYVIAGEGPDRTLFENKIKECGLENQVRLCGFVDNRRAGEFCVQALLNAADVFVLPSYFEGFPVSVLEAMAMKKPVICTPVSGIEGAFEDGEDVQLIPFKNSEKTSVAISEFLSSKPNVLESRVLKAQKKVIENYYPEVLVQKLSDLYDELA